MVVNSRKLSRKYRTNLRIWRQMFKAKFSPNKQTNKQTRKEEINLVLVFITYNFSKFSFATATNMLVKYFIEFLLICVWLVKHSIMHGTDVDVYIAMGH